MFPYGLGWCRTPTYWLFGWVPDMISGPVPGMMIDIYIYIHIILHMYCYDTSDIDIVKKIILNIIQVKYLYTLSSSICTNMRKQVAFAS